MRHESLAERCNALALAYAAMQRELETLPRTEATEELIRQNREILASAKRIAEFASGSATARPSSKPDQPAA